MSQTYSSVTLCLKKSTKGTHVYANEERGFTGVYIPREFLPAQAPVAVVLTLSSVEAGPGSDADNQSTTNEERL